MSKTAKGKTEPAASPVKAGGQDEAPKLGPAQEAIEIRAYHIYLERGGGDGDPIEDWLQAERELAESNGR